MSYLPNGAPSRNEIPIARLQYLASRIHKLGPRPLFELLRELASGATFLVSGAVCPDRAPCCVYRVAKWRPVAPACPTCRGATVTDLQIEPVARVLLGVPNKHLSKPTELRYGTHGSLKIDLNKNAWFDHEANCGGGVLDLVNREIGGDHSDARRWLADNGLEAKPNGNGCWNLVGVSSIRMTTSTSTASCCSRQFATSLKGSANGGPTATGLDLESRRRSPSPLPTP